MKLLGVVFILVGVLLHTEDIAGQGTGPRPLPPGEEPGGGSGGGGGGDPLTTTTSPPMDITSTTTRVTSPSTTRTRRVRTTRSGRRRRTTISGRDPRRQRRSTTTIPTRRPADTNRNDLRGGGRRGGRGGRGGRRGSLDGRRGGYSRGDCAPDDDYYDDDADEPEYEDEEDTPEYDELDDPNDATGRRRQQAGRPPYAVPRGGNRPVRVMSPYRAYYIPRSGGGGGRAPRYQAASGGYPRYYRYG